jgi:hypothetical protein
MTKLGNLLHQAIIFGRGNLIEWIFRIDGSPFSEAFSVEYRLAIRGSGEMEKL